MVAEQSMTPEQVVSAATAAHLRLIRFMYCDSFGVIRGKATHLSSLAERMAGGIGLTVAMQAFVPLDHLASVPGMGPVGEIRLVPDPDTFVVLPYAPNCGLMLADMIELDRQPWAACPRTFLKRQLARANARDYELIAAFEPEFTLAVQDEDGSYQPIDESLCFSGIGFLAAQRVTDAIVEAFERQAMVVEQYYPELGHGQQELSIRHAPALQAADNQVKYRETVRAVAHDHGLVASFAPKPFADQAGNGCHIHFSLWSAGRNVFHDPRGEYGLSDTARAFTAGVLEHAPALVALTAPSVNSYRRLAPGMWSSAFAAWGPDNREAAVRVASPFWGNEAGSTNLELKPSDNTANPYLALGSLLAAGLDGIERQLEPGPPALVDPGTLSEPEREAARMGRLPTTLNAALDALERDRVLLDALGPALASSYIAGKRLEAQLYAEQDEAFELRHHFFKY
jgi:glutamine synthetase